MNKLITAIGLISVCSFSFAEEANSELEALNKKISALMESAPKGKHGGRMISPELQALMQERQGGLLYPKSNGRAILIVDARSDTQDDIMSDFAATAKRVFFVPVKIDRDQLSDEEDPYSFALKSKNDKLPSVILIVDREKMPTLIIYPEDAIGVINVSTLKDNDIQLYSARLQKELWRALGMTLGGYADASPTGKMAGGVLCPIFSVSQLDEITDKGMTGAQFNGIYASAPKLGLPILRPVPYSTACRQGWAPSPTNGIQKAIWDKVHAPPTNPIKIKFDPATDGKDKE